MKKIFFVIAIASFSFVTAQQNRSLPDTLKFYNSNLNQSLVTVDGQVLDLLPNKNKTNVLSQDNMPCIVPDMSQFHMPVIKPNVVYTIPNPALPPWRTKSSTLSKEELERLFKLHQPQH